MTTTYQLHQLTKQLFEVANRIGEILTGELHLLNLSGNDDETAFRIYHNAGYCFDVKRLYVCEPSDVSKHEDVLEDGFTYVYFCEWQGFKLLSEKAATMLLLAVEKELIESLQTA